MCKKLNGKSAPNSEFQACPKIHFVSLCSSAGGIGLGCFQHSASIVVAVFGSPSVHSSSFCLRSSSDSQCRSGRARGRFYVSEWPRVSPPSAPPKRFGSCCRPRGQIVSGRVLGTATDMCQLRLVGRPVRAPQHVIRASPNRDSEVICLSFSFQEAPKEFQSHDPLSLSNLRCALRLRPPAPNLNVDPIERHFRNKQQF